MNSQHSFIKGTAIIIGANAVSKILGAVFKIPLTYIIKEEGMAIFNTAMSVYSMLLSFIVSGLPLALSRLIAEEFALKNYSNVKRTVKLATLILCALGLLGTAVLYLFADFFAFSMKDPKASLAIRVISPSVFFVAWGTVYKSFYQGCVNMIPTAASQVAEAFIRLAIGFFGAYILRDALLEVTSAGAVSGITIGEIIATLILFIMFIPSSKKLPNIGEKKRKRYICRTLASVAVPMLACSCISGSISLLDTASIRNSLLNINFTPQTAERFLLQYSSYTTVFDKLSESLKMTVDGARWLYGAYSGYTLTIFHLPTGIIGALGVCVLPMISGAIAKNDQKLVNRTICVSLQLTAMIALPCAVLIGIFSEQLLDFLFRNTASAHLLSLLAPCLVFVCISELFTVILHASGRIFEPFLYSLIGMAVKLLANFFLIPRAEFNISGAVIGSTAAFFIIMLLNFASVIRNMKISPNLRNTILKPLISSALMGIIMRLIYTPMTIIFANETMAIFISIFVGFTAYFLALLSMNALNKNSFNLNVLSD